MKILLTGAAASVGMHVALRLLARGDFDDSSLSALDFAVQASPRAPAGRP
jgi:nucleoside-diphosphate-sugar epimerase